MSSSDVPVGISRRSFLLSTLALSALDYTTLLAKTPAGSPTIIRGPYLQRTTDNGVVIMWRTDVECESRVHFGINRDNLSLVYHSSGPVTEHTARIIGMDPKTIYYYEIRDEDRLIGGGTQNHYFMTAPEKGSKMPTRIWVLGDIGWPTEELRQVRDEYYDYTNGRHTDLCLLLGDIAYSHGRDREYQAPLFDMFRDLVCCTPTWPTYGNHDSYCNTCDSTRDTGPYFDIFKVPNSGQAGGVPSYSKAYYSFDYGNIHFISLNSTDWQGSQMLEWLYADLSKSEPTWTIVFWHHPAYSRGAYDSDVSSELALMRTEVMPILERYGVDLILTGHNHCYERSYLINGHHGTADTIEEKMILSHSDGTTQGGGIYVKTSLSQQPDEGLVHISMGCSSIIKDGSLDHPAMYKSVADFGSLVIDVVDNQLNAKMINNMGRIIDEFTIQRGSRNYLPIA